MKIIRFFCFPLSLYLSLFFFSLSYPFLQQSEWCFYFFPSIYSYVQSHYWYLSFSLSLPPTHYVVYSFMIQGGGSVKILWNQTNTKFFACYSRSFVLIIVFGRLFFCFNSSKVLNLAFDWSVYLYLSISIYLYLYLSLSISISIYLSLSIYLYLYLSLSISIYLCLSLSLFSIFNCYF